VHLDVIKMNHQYQDPSEVEDETCAQHTEANITRQGSLMHILRISQLQTYIREAKGKLAQISRESEAIRRRVKSQALTHRSLGAIPYSQSEVNDFLALIALLEEENAQLKALSVIPVEIEQLKAELRDVNKPDGKSVSEGNEKDLQRANELLKLQLEEAVKKLKETEERLQRLEDCPKPDPDPQSPVERKEEEFISFQKHFQDQFSVTKPAKPLVPASPASNHTTVSKHVPVTTKTKPSPHRVQPKMFSFNAGKPKGKARGYSPTFLRLQKGDRKRQESTSPGGKKQVKDDDDFPDCFPEEQEVGAEELRHVG
jgi:hypothetical protein